MKLNNVFVSAFLVAAMSGGGNKAGPPSPIVKKLADGGAGDVSSASEQSIEQWFRQHREVAKEIRQDCSRAKATKSVDWGETTEGRVCHAVESASVFGNEHQETDQRKF